jgi:hypothetical protein
MSRTSFVRALLRCPGNRRLFLHAAIGAVFFLAAPCASSLAYIFGPSVTAVGPEQTVFKWSTDACEPLDIPDTPARAFRDASGRVQMLASHYVTRRMVGPTLDSVQHQCTILLDSTFNPDPAAFEDKNWLASPYTLDGQTVYALLHDEYQGYTHAGRCDPSYQGTEVLRCWFNAITFARSTDGGDSYQLAPRSSRIVASLPYPYAAGDGPYGLFSPSNIVYRPSDGYYYVMVANYRPFKAQPKGTCLLRTQNLAEPGSWRSWDGTAFSVSFLDPYSGSNARPAGHVCRPVSPDQIGVMTSSLTYNTYFRKFILIGGSSAQNPKTGRTVYGFFYSLSSDLIHWAPQHLLMRADFPWTYQCGSEKPALNPSILDPNSASRNFETTGQTVDLYFTRSNFSYGSGHCWWSLDRDLVRVPIQFSGASPANQPPVCSDVTGTPNIIRPPNHKLVPVSLSGASDPDGDRVTLTVTGVTQDEPLNGTPDATLGPQSNQLSVRAERGGDGRVYRIAFSASDGKGGNCTGTATVNVPRNDHSPAVDSAPPSYDSLAR